MQRSGLRRGYRAWHRAELFTELLVCTFSALTGRWSITQAIKSTWQDHPGNSSQHWSKYSVNTDRHPGEQRAATGSIPSGAQCQHLIQTHRNCPLDKTKLGLPSSSPRTSAPSLSNPKAERVSQLRPHYTNPSSRSWRLNTPKISSFKTLTEPW